MSKVIFEVCFGSRVMMSDGTKSMPAEHFITNTYTETRHQVNYMYYSGHCREPHLICCSDCSNVLNNNCQLPGFRQGFECADVSLHNASRRPVQEYIWGTNVHASGTGLSMPDYVILALLSGDDFEIISC